MKTLVEQAERFLEEEIKDERFFNAYVTAALWSSTDDKQEPLDSNYSISDIAPETLKKMREDCEKFEVENDVLYTEGGWDDEQAGHDFWLTRNHHGAGFWDRNFNEKSNEIGKKLTDIAHSYGSFDLYVGDDGMIHA